MDGRVSRAHTASLVGAAKSAPYAQSFTDANSPVVHPGGALDGRVGKAHTASLVGAAKSAP